MVDNDNDQGKQKQTETITITNTNTQEKKNKKNTNYIQGCLQSCEMSQIWQIYLCKNIEKLG